MKQDIYNGIEQRMLLAEINIKDPTAVEVVLDLAVYGLLAMTEKHSVTHKQVMTLQVLSGHLANVLKGMGESEGIGRIREDRKAVAEVIDKVVMSY